MIGALQVLFRKFLDNWFITDQWKTVNVIPISNHKFTYHPTTDQQVLLVKFRNS